MPLESATYIDQLVPANPVHGDDVNQGDAHLRLVKSVLQNQFPNFTAAALASTNAAIDAVVSLWNGIVTLATGVVTLAASLTVNDNLAVGGTLGALGNTTLGGTLGVAGLTTLAAGLDFVGPLVGPAPVTVAGSTYVVGASDVVLYVTVATTLTLPSASANSGRQLWVRTTSSSKTISTANTDVIEMGDTAASTGVFVGSGAVACGLWCLLLSNGTSWVQMAGDTIEL